MTYMLISRSKLFSASQTIKLKNRFFLVKLMLLIQHFTSTSVPWFLHYSKWLYHHLIVLTKKLRY